MQKSPLITTWLTLFLLSAHLCHLLPGSTGRLHCHLSHQLARLQHLRRQRRRRPSRRVRRHAQHAYSHPAHVQLRRRARSKHYLHPPRQILDYGNLGNHIGAIGTPQRSLLRPPLGPQILQRSHRLYDFRRLLHHSLLLHAQTHPSHKTLLTRHHPRSRRVQERVRHCAPGFNHPNRLLGLVGMDSRSNLPAL